MDGKNDPEGQKRLKEAVQASQAAAKALTRDVVALSRQAALLKTRAAEVRMEPQETRAQGSQPHPLLASSLLLTIPEAARLLHVAERTLWHVLTEPDLQAHLIEQTRKVGIYDKFLSLLPPNLLADLSAHFTDKKPPGRRHPAAQE